MEIPTSEILNISMVDGEDCDGLILSISGTGIVVLFSTNHLDELSESIEPIITGYLDAFRAASAD